MQIKKYNINISKEEEKIFIEISNIATMKLNKNMPIDKKQEDYFIDLLVNKSLSFLHKDEKTKSDINNYLSIKYYNYYYPTYINSIYINTNKGKLLLVPKFSKLEYMEDEIVNIYKKYYSDTKIAFVNSDYIIRQHGALHCITNVLPYIDKSNVGHVVNR